MHRLYENNDIVIFWNSVKCYHAKRCVTGSPRTFDINRKPWIDMSLADNPEIWQTVSTCPSGALTCVYKHDVDVRFDETGHRSVAYAGDKQIGECVFTVDGDGWTIVHTAVKQEFEGKGIAKRLVYKVIESAERAKVKIGATCSYALKVLSE
ncbi:MAG: GNAT family N-acetyltransferase [Lachnospiraceae bacterium]|nr:GNAT family N-acetyltransferase [Lachnospiraceae bacterium]MBR1862362.1 GNAT family N-acetyltransferase [Lachnospiraceae bacterium]